MWLKPDRSQKRRGSDQWPALSFLDPNCPLIFPIPSFYFLCISICLGFSKDSMVDSGQLVASSALWFNVNFTVSLGRVRVLPKYLTTEECITFIRLPRWSCTWANSDFHPSKLWMREPRLRECSWLSWDLQEPGQHCRLWIWGQGILSTFASWQMKKLPLPADYFPNPAKRDDPLKGDWGLISCQGL